MVTAGRMSAAEAATRLGVKRETLYAYVSRGMLTSERGADGRSSTFSAHEVAAFAERTRRGGRSGGLELIVASALTLIEDGRLCYRGVDVADLVPATPFESVAEWLWTGDPAALESLPLWPRPNLPGPFPTLSTSIDRLRVSVAVAGSSDEMRYDLESPSVVAAGRMAIAAMVEGLPALGPETESTEFPLAGRLVTRLTDAVASPGLVEIVNAVLVLLADHELAASTLAARVAASVRADPYSVISTGLGTIAGALHGAASEPLVELLGEIGEPGRAARVVGERLRRGERIHGLGHKVYRQTDPRAEILLGMLRAMPQPPERWEVVEELLALLRQRLPLVVNVDFALGALVWSMDLDLDTAETLFAIARSAGWLAHALEEYAEAPVRFRPRAAYTGERPVPS